jgi:hypothetical protein
MSTANQKQALVHIYNIVTGSSVAVNLEKFKTEVQSCTAIKMLVQKVFWFLVFKIKNAISFGY